MKLWIEKKCQAIVKYTCYPRRGVRSDRHGKCSRWTARSCGLCRRHCEMRAIHGCTIVWSARALTALRRAVSR